MTNGRADRGVSVSTVLGRRLGGELLRLREACGLRQAHAAEALSASVPKVAKMERGLVPMRDPDIRALCHLYGMDDEPAIGRLVALAKTDRERRKAKGWWNQYAELPHQVEYFVLEDIASLIRTWQLAYVPGLLQTPDYARALAVDNPVWNDSGNIEPFVASRMSRQARLTGERPLHLWALIHEGALRQLVGGRDIMRAQLDHLREAAHLPNVKVQVVPFQAGAHPGLTNAFTIVSFAEPGAVDVVRADIVWTSLWLEGETDAARHNAVFDRVVRLGLDQRSSSQLIEHIRDEM